MQAKIVLPNEELEYGAAEAIKTLRTNIMYSEDVKAIMLTSTMPSEGKSTVSLELARSFAALGKNTVLMDCDMRKRREEISVLRMEARLGGGAPIRSPEKGFWSIPP